MVQSDIFCLDTVKRSINHHLQKHGQGKTIEQYTNDALDFYNKNKSSALNIKLNDGSPGVKIQVGNQKGWYTPDGRIVSYLENK
jgi:hypothetical protein